MRIQHSIMIVNAYRSYNTNTSALSKNLEKLSSGYKINRAGDDAAGLAISEKMRAQITGLNAAQKNVKDGISLVKTAEGAMQEIQDMLNRMDYLATQSANGTYDNEVDRAALQKEVDQLKTEINRIADSANFNGIKLLDGSLDVKATSVGATEAEAGTVTSLVSSSLGSTLGTNTIVHTGGTEATTTQFGVDLHELAFSNKTGETLTLKIGDDEFTLDGGDAGTAGTAPSAADIATTFKDGKFNVNGTAMTAEEATVNGGTFTVKTDGTRITFEQNVSEDPVNGDLNVSVTGTEGAAIAPTKAAVTETTPGDAANSAVYTYDFTGVTGLTAGKYDVEIAGQKVSVELTGTPDADALAAAVQAKLTAPEDGIGAVSKYTVGNTGSTITFTASAVGTIAADNAISGDIKVTSADAEPSVTGGYNTTTTVTVNGAEEAAGRIASGVATLTKDTFADGNIIKIGDKEYTVTTDAAKKDDASSIYVGGLDLTSADGLKAAIDELPVKADSNSVWTIGHGAAAGQVTFTEKVDANGKSYTDLNSTNGKLNDGAFDLSKEDVIKETFGTVTGKKEATAGENGKALVLQIGDTSDEFNHLKVGVGDMHVSAMGIMNTDKDGAPDGVAEGKDGKAQSIENIDISTREGASKAIDVIKAAINYVSGIRGDLGAIQNRLEHTANNLSVMTENIQDAESTIRDTDIAEEMMSYTKNNILVQSAQAMLAQANAVPQGVLQLLG